MSTLKMGGGQNVALNFLIGLQKMTVDEIKLHFFVAERSALHAYLESISAQNFTVTPRNPIRRIFFELLAAPFLIRRYRIDIVYSYFGYAFLPKRIPQVTGSADSNIYFPEIDFWRGYNGIQRLRRWFVDCYRIWGVRRAAGVVFENAAMQERGRRLFGLRETKYIRPSLTLPENPMDYSLPDATTSYSALFLCGWQLNKGVMLIPHLAREAKTRGMDVRFILTAPLDKSRLHREFERLTAELGVADRVTVTGTVKKEQLESLYRQIDCVILLSKLESFSNNIIEAWHFKKPLIIASEEWARSICKEAALYVDRNSEASILEAIELLSRDRSASARVIENGSRELNEYPSIEERIRLEVDYLRHVYEIH